MDITTKGAGHLKIIYKIEKFIVFLAKDPLNNYLNEG